MKSLLLIRRVEGNSMLPTLKSGELILASSLFQKLKVKDLIILKNDGREIVKRIKHINNEKVYIVGDNLAVSTDSRQYGWLGLNQIQAKVLWPLK